MPYQTVVKALYSYEATDEDELSFVEDELLCILPAEGDRDDSWLLAMPLQRSEVSGLIPANYIEPLESMGGFVAQFDYDAQEDNELNFKGGDCLHLLSKIDENEEWWLMKNSQGLFGLIPANYVMPENADPRPPQSDQTSVDELNIFQSPLLPTKGTLKSLFPASKSKKKWPAELVQGSSKIKGKLHLLDGTSVAFVHGKEKIVELHYRIEQLDSFDRQEGFLFLKGESRPLRLVLGKSDGKDLAEAIIAFHATNPTKIAYPIADVSGPLHNGEDHIEQPIVHGEDSTRGQVSREEPPESFTNAPVTSYSLEEAPYEHESFERINASYEEESFEKAHLSHGNDSLEKTTPSDEIDGVEGAIHNPDRITHALYDYIAQQEDELDLVEDEMVFLVDDSDSDWWIVAKADGSAQGLVPSTYVAKGSFVVEADDTDRNQLVEEPLPADVVAADYDYDNDQDERVEESSDEARNRDIGDDKDTEMDRPASQPLPFINELLIKSHKSMEMLKSMETSHNSSSKEKVSETVNRPIERSSEPPPLPDRPTESVSSGLEKPTSAPIQSNIVPIAPPLPNRPVEVASTKRGSDTRESCPKSNPITSAPPLPLPIEVRKATLPSKKESLNQISKTVPENNRDQASSRLPEHTFSEHEIVKANEPPSVSKSNPWSSVSFKTTGSVSMKNTPTISGLANMSAMAKTLPSRPEKPNSSTKTRLWKDKSGKFQTEAAFLSFEQGLVCLHKLNGSKVSVPIDLLSERDVEYVYRRVGLDLSSISRKQTSLEVPRPDCFKVNGFDWLQFFVGCGIDSTRSVDLAKQCVLQRCDNLWLDHVSRDKFKEKININVGDCLLVMQGITKRKLQQLERLGQDNLLRSIASNTTRANASSAPHPVDPKVTRPAMMTALEPKQMRATSLPVIESQSLQQPPLLPHRSIKNIPVMQPQNSITSINITPQPMYREHASAGLVTLPDGRVAQQSTSTQYMVRRSTMAEGVSPSPTLLNPNIYPSSMAPMLPATSVGVPGLGPSQQMPLHMQFTQPPHYNGAGMMMSGMMPPQFNNVAHAGPSSGVPMFTPTRPLNNNAPAVIPNPAVISNVDKYDVFKQVDPRAPSFLSQRPPQFQQQNPPPPYTGFGAN